MPSEIHPTVSLIKREFFRGHHRYKDISDATGISLQRLKNIMSGRQEITLAECDRLCDFLSISPLMLSIRRDDLFEGNASLDLTVLSESKRRVLILLYIELCHGVELNPAI